MPNTDYLSACESITDNGKDKSIAPCHPSVSLDAKPVFPAVLARSQGHVFHEPCPTISGLFPCFLLHPQSTAVETVDMWMGPDGISISVLLSFGKMLQRGNQVYLGECNFRFPFDVATRH